MNIELPNITPSRGVERTTEMYGADKPKPIKEGLRPLFGDSLQIEEKTTLSLDALDGIDLDAMEKELDRKDALGTLLSSHLSWDPPEMPDFV